MKHGGFMHLALSTAFVLYFWKMFLICVYMKIY